MNKRDDLWLPPDDPFRLAGNILKGILIPFLIFLVYAPIGIPLSAVLSLFVEPPHHPLLIVIFIIISLLGGAVFWKMMYNRWKRLSIILAVVTLSVELVYVYYKWLIPAYQASL